MADPVIDPTVSAPAAAPVAAPTPVVAPAELAPVASPPAVASSPAEAAPTIPAVAPVEPAKPAGPAEPAPSLLSEAGKVEPPKPGDPAAPAPVTAEPSPAPTYEPFTTPEGVKLGDGEIGKFTELLGKFETEHKADHAAVQALGQQLVDFYLADRQRESEAQAENWNRTRDGWRNQFLSDPEIGGNRKETTLAACGAMIEQYGGNAAQITELRSAFRVTGMGDHPALIRMLANIGKALGEGRPVPATVPKSPLTVPKSARRYSTSMNNGAN